MLKLSSEYVFIASQVLAYHFQSLKSDGITSVMYSGLCDAITTVVGSPETAIEKTEFNIIHDICSDAINAMYSTLQK